MNEFVIGLQQELRILKERKNFRSLPALVHEGKEVVVDGKGMLNLS